MAGNLIAGIACASIVVLLWALLILVTHWKRTLSVETRRLVAALLIVSVLHEISNLLEWTVGDHASMPLEDYFLLLLPAIWGVFFYTFLQSQSRAKLRRSEERYRSLTDDVLETTSAGICILDSNKHVVWVNQAVEGYFGLRRNEILGRHCDRLVEGRLKHMVEKPAEFAARMHVACEGDGVQEIECHILPGAVRQERWLECRVQPIHSGLYAGGTIKHFYDVTERKKAAEVREELMDVLETQKAELERFVYTVSHDLKSPLITIRGFLGILRDNLEDGGASEARSDMERIERAAERMQRLLDELLELARIGRDNIEMTRVDLGQVIGEVLEGLHADIDRRGVAVSVLDEAPVVWGHRTRLAEVFQNLVDNAIKYLGDQSAAEIEIGANAGEKEVVCFVRDNGIGIDSRYERKVFDLFEQLDPKYPGTGVGLAIVKRIVEMHGGRIWIESDGAGYGTTFWFTLSNRQPRKEIENHGGLTASTAAQTAN